MKSFLLGEETEVTGAGTLAPVRMQVPAQDLAARPFPPHQLLAGRVQPERPTRAPVQWASVPP